MMWWRLSALGDTALLAPASLAVLLYLVTIRRWVDARAFLAALALGLGLTLASKLLFKACGGAIDVLNLNSPSGHASFATLFYGSLALMLGWGRSRLMVGLIWAATVPLLLAIGASRAAQDAHNWPEVGVGWLVGLAGLAVFVALRRGAETPPLSPYPLAVGLAAAVLLLGGRHFTPEHYIDRIAQAASISLDVCREPRVTALTPSLPVQPR
jgi:MYXO-CTERM domain-containing protein